MGSSQEVKHVCAECGTIYAGVPFSTCPKCGPLFELSKQQKQRVVNASSLGKNVSPELPEPYPTVLEEQIGGDHYKDLPIQPVEFITKNKIPFLEGCVIKRMCRHGKKNKLEDLKKAVHEIRLIAKLTYKETI